MKDDMQKFEQYYPDNWEWRESRPTGERTKWGGLNDSPYVTGPKVGGKPVWCPAYAKWRDMLRRVYSPRELARRPTYIGTEVCKEWLDSFMAYREWFFVELSKTDLQAGVGQVDKDFLTDCKLYSPETCILIPNALNKLLTDSGAIRGDLPQGVRKRRSGYEGTVCTPNGRRSKTFKTAHEAAGWYRDRKIEVIKSAPIPYWLDETKIRNRLLDIFNFGLLAQ